MGLNPGPLQPGASTKGGDGGIVVQDPGCAVTLQSVALRCGPRIWSKMFGWGGGVRIASRQPFVRRRDGQEEVGLGLRSGYI